MQRARLWWDPSRLPASPAAVFPGRGEAPLRWGGVMQTDARRPPSLTWDKYIRNGVLGLTATVGLNQLIHHMGLDHAAPDSGQAFVSPPFVCRDVRRRSVSVVVLSC